MTESRRVTFPVIGDDETLQRDTRVIFTNQQLITRNPSLKEEGLVGKGSAPAKKEKKYSEQFKPYESKVSYNTQHRALNGKHSGVNSFDKMPKKTSVDESKERAKRAAAELPPRVKEYVSPLDRDKDHVSVRRNSAMLNKNKRPMTNDNPIQDMKKRGMNISDALSNSGMTQAQPRKNMIAKTQSQEYFDNKRKGLFDRGMV